MQLETDDAIVTIEVTPEMKEEVFRRVLAFITTHGAFSGESIMQRDTPTIDAPLCLSDIVDEVLCPVVNWKD